MLEAQSSGRFGPSSTLKSSVQVLKSLESWHSIVTPWCHVATARHFDTPGPGPRAARCIMLARNARIGSGWHSITPQKACPAMPVISTSGLLARHDSLSHCPPSRSSLPCQDAVSTNSTVCALAGAASDCLPTLPRTRCPLITRNGHRQDSDTCCFSAFPPFPGPASSWWWIATCPLAGQLPAELPAASRCAVPTCNGPRLVCDAYGIRSLCPPCVTGRSHPRKAHLRLPSAASPLSHLSRRAVQTPQVKYQSDSLLRVGARCPPCNRPRLACAASWLRTRCPPNGQVAPPQGNTSGFYLESRGSRRDCFARWRQGPVEFPTPRVARRWRYKRRLLFASFSRLRCGIATELAGGSRQVKVFYGRSRAFTMAGLLATYREFGSARVAVRRVMQYPPCRSAAASADHTLAAQGFSARLEAVLFPMSCSVEHALASRKWQPGMRGG